ncbi:hypothetical protein HYW61_01970 [candidate division WWE3 bacterium]|nr:hypothetical protein [candidate division WWE3 bacterium]
MGIAFVFHLYQPPTQDEETFRRIAESSYLPLVKLIKTSKKFRLTLNVPLSLLEQMDRYGYGAWIESVKGLVASEKVELTGSGAYHPLLTKLPDNLVEKQIVLNEYGLGYYFGKRTGFEGEPSIMIRDISGFFPPELAVNDRLFQILSEFGYKWVLVDELALPVDVGVCGELSVVGRNRALSDVVSFKRDLNVGDFFDCLNWIGKSPVVALDGEVFGHHYKDGIVMLDKIISELESRGVETLTVSEYLSSFERPATIDGVVESSWSSYDKEGKIVTYPLWENPENEIQNKLWEMHNALAALYSGREPLTALSAGEGMENTAVWTSKVPEIGLDILVAKAFHSDQFWWVSGATIGGVTIYNVDMAVRAISLYKKIADRLDDANFRKLVEVSAIGIH